VLGISMLTSVLAMTSELVIVGTTTVDGSIKTVESIVCGSSLSTLGVAVIMLSVDGSIEVNVGRAVIVRSVILVALSCI